MKLLQKKNKFVSILSIIAVLFTLNPITSFADSTLNDIAEHWAKDQIESWVGSGYIKGYPDGTFKPDNRITRAEFMTLVNHAYEYTEKAEISYKDVPEGSWYADAVAAAKAAGYITGYPDDTMKPNASITRQEAAVIIARIDALTSDEAAANQFTDAENIPAWSKGAIGAGVQAGILTGYPDGSFQGGNLILRGESVVALTKAKEYKTTHVTVAKTVANISATGFGLALSPAVDGLTQENVILTQGDTSITISAITTQDSGATYGIEAALEEGKTYTLRVSKEGYAFGEDSTIILLAAEQEDETANKEIADAVNSQIAALPAADALTLEDAADVTAAKTKFDALTAEQKVLITEENKDKLTAVTAKIDELQLAASQTNEEPQA